MLKPVGDTLNSNRLYQTGGKLMWKNTALKRILKYYVGYWYPSLGGYVMEVSPYRKHGTVVAYRDHFTNRNWYSGTEFFNDESYWNSGQYSYSKNFKDWRLPTKRELKIIRTMKDNIGNLSNDYYWSSTESNPTYAYTVKFPGVSTPSKNKATQNSIRLVRTF